MRLNSNSFYLAAAIIAGSFVLAAGSAQAQENLTSLRSTAMGDAYVGGGGGNGALFHNPAGMAAVSIYSIEAGYNYDQTGACSSFGASIVDSKTNPNFAGGLSFVYDTSNYGTPDDRTDDFRGYDARLGLAVPLVPNVLTFGFAGHFFHHRTFEAAVDDGGDEIIQDINENALTLDLGLMAAVSENFVLGLATENLWSIRGDEQDRALSGGAAVFVGALHLEGSYGRALAAEIDSPNVFAVGAEYLLNVIPLRIGYRVDGPNDERVVSVGAGWRSETAGLDFAFTQDVELATNRTFGLTLSMYL